MFSRRLAWPHHENRLAALLREKRGRGKRLHDLTESNPTRAGIAYPGERIAAALADPGVVAYEPDPRGLSEARAAVAAWCARRGIDASADRMVLTASTSEAYAFLFKMLADPGDTILVPRPSYPLFDYLAALEAVRVAPYPFALDHRWQIDPAALERALRAPSPAAPARAVVVVNPNNPTGTALRAGERAAIDALCAGSGAALISDEVFLDYLFGEAAGTASAAAAGTGARPDDIVSAAGRRTGAPPAALTFTLGGLSKACGLPQMKLGWILVDGPEDLRQEALERLEFIADAFLSVGTPVQRAAGRLLAIGDEVAGLIRARVRANLAVLQAAVPQSSSCRVLAADGGWYAVLQVPAVQPEEDLVLALLDRDDVVVHPGYFFDFPREAFLVLSLLPEPATFAAAVERVVARAAG
jgi:aspartate/methionine/tyrosine aminotransferase